MKQNSRSLFAVGCRLGRSATMLVMLGAAPLLALLTFIAAATPARAAEETENPDVVLLRRHGVSADGRGIAVYLGNLIPDAKSQERIAQLIAQLDSEDFAVREAATRDLSGIGAARQALVAATRDPSPEVSYRARRILANTDSEQEGLLLAALRTIQKQKLTGMAPQLIRLMPMFPKEYLQRSLIESLAVSAGPEDVPLLQTSIQSNRAEIRTGAIVALERVSGEGAIESLRPLLRADDDATRLAACEALVNRLSRECLPVLLALLESDQPQVRVLSDRILRGLTGQKFGYLGGNLDASARAAIVSKWQQWAEGPGRTAALHVPVSLTPARLGRTLICLNGGFVRGGGNGSLVLEMDEGGTVKPLPVPGAMPLMPFGCQGLPDGHRLLTDWRSQAVIELDAEGKELWRKQMGGNPAAVDRLDNGNTLVALYPNRQLVELDANHNVVWQMAVNGMPSDAHGLENGNILVALSDQGKVAELDRKGKEVWKVDGLQNPWSARRLPDGRTLVACTSGSRVVELSPDGKTLWSVDSIPNCFDAVALDNGNILIANAMGLREVDRQGKTVRDRPVGMVRRISVY
ncbi:MAG: hypothetical protein K8T25_17770 [Planctomycetia bacterium]|nr:hypothetical protein [Planctomycetia bacterium]